MRTVQVDPGARIAVSLGGATWMDFDAATQAHGLVTPGGVVGSTGVADCKGEVISSDAPVRDHRRAAILSPL